MTNKTRVFLTGATGYLGGQILVDFLARKDADKFVVATLVRGSDRAATLEKLGAVPVLGDLNDSELIKREASVSDVVIHAADADHVPSATAIIEGLRDRKVKTGKKGIYIHTSGSAICWDISYGKYIFPKIYSDLDVEAIDALPDTNLHRNVDLIVRSAGASGDVDTYLVIPPTIYGVGAGPFHKTSIQIPALIRAAIKAGKSQYVGEGVPRWSKVHVADLSNLYSLIVDHALAHPDPSTPHQFQNYYFSETGEYSWKEAADAIGKELVLRGKVKSGESTSFENEKVVGELLGPYGMVVWGSNSRTVADRARALGWKPLHGADFYKSIGEEVEYIIKNEA
ncbi:hypothetical protein HDU93_005071 [Gonapodya sp. JEL0774]|nr:hypothetical protein HDU93_005071 [Gonapodya sp. JEL0774]